MLQADCRFVDKPMQPPTSFNGIRAALRAKAKERGAIGMQTVDGVAANFNAQFTSEGTLGAGSGGPCSGYG